MVRMYLPRIDSLSLSTHRRLFIWLLFECYINLTVDEFSIFSIHGVVVIASTQLYSTNPKFRFCAGSNPDCGVSEIRDGENLWQWFAALNKANCLSSVNHTTKQFIIIIIIIQLTYIWNQMIQTKKKKNVKIIIIQ